MPYLSISAAHGSWINFVSFNNCSKCITLGMNRLKSSFGVEKYHFRCKQSNFLYRCLIRKGHICMFVESRPFKQMQLLSKSSKHSWNCIMLTINFSNWSEHYTRLFYISSRVLCIKKHWPFWTHKMRRFSENPNRVNLVSFVCM